MEVSRTDKWQDVMATSMLAFILSTCCYPYHIFLAALSPLVFLLAWARLGWMKLNSEDPESDTKPGLTAKGVAISLVSFFFVGLRYMRVLT